MVTWQAVTAYDPESAVGGDVAELQGLLGGLGYQLPDDGIYGYYN